MPHESRDNYRSTRIPLSPYAIKQNLLKGKKVLFNGVPMTQIDKCLLLTSKSELEIERISEGRDFNYTTVDKPGWVNGDLMSQFEYERYLTGIKLISKYNYQ